VTGLAALLIAAAATTSTAMPAGYVGDARNADSQRARRLSLSLPSVPWDDLASVDPKDFVSNLEKDIKNGVAGAGKAVESLASGAANDAKNGVVSAGEAVKSWASGAMNANLPFYGKHCGKDSNNPDRVAAIDPLDKACQLHDTCTRTNYDQRSERFKQTFAGVVDWGSRTGKIQGSCLCEMQSLMWAVAASCRGLPWYRRFRCEMSKTAVIAFFGNNVQVVC